MIIDFHGNVAYFDKSGIRSKMKIDNCKRSEVREKLMETLLIASKFTHLNP